MASKRKTTNGATERKQRFSDAALLLSEMRAWAWKQIGVQDLKGKELTQFRNRLAADLRALAKPYNPAADRRREAAPVLALAAALRAYAEKTRPLGLYQEEARTLLRNIEREVRVYGYAEPKSRAGREGHGPLKMLLMELRTSHPGLWPAAWEALSEDVRDQLVGAVIGADLVDRYAIDSLVRRSPKPTLNDGLEIVRKRIRLALSDLTGN